MLLLLVLASSFGLGQVGGQLWNRISASCCETTGCDCHDLPSEAGAPGCCSSRSSEKTGPLVRAARCDCGAHGSLDWADGGKRWWAPARATSTERASTGLEARPFEHAEHWRSRRTAPEVPPPR